MSWEGDKAPPERTVGAYSVGTEEPPRRPGWLIPLLILLGLALLALLLWVLLHGRGTDEKKTVAEPAAGTSASPSPTPSAAPSTAPAGAGTGSATGRLLAGGQPVPADEGFWVGDGVTDRVWVQLAGAGESGYTVKPGDRVSFTAGKVVATGPAFAGQVGLNAAEGAAQLTAQGQHITVAKGDLRLSS